MFKKLFGGGDKKKEEAPPPPPPPPPVSKDVQAEKIIVDLDAQIRSMTDMSNKLESRAQNLTAKAKDYMAQNKKKEAKAAVAQLAEIKKKIELINTRKKVLRTQKNQLEVARIDINMADQMGQATDFLKGLQSVNDRMTDIMLDAREIQTNMEETNRLMKELAGEDQEDTEADELFKELQNQVQTNKAQQITAGLNQQKPQVVKPVAVQQSTVATNKSAHDDLDQWLNN